MPDPTTLHIRQRAAGEGRHDISLTLKRGEQPDLEAEANIEFGLTPDEQEELRWYLEDYLLRAEAVQDVQVEQIEQWMRRRGEQLYAKVLAADMNTQAIWFAVRGQLADLRIEITTGVAEAASIPWELMRDPQSESPIALRVKSFVRVQSNPNIDFVKVPPADEGRVRLLYVVCRPGGRNDVELRAVANRLLQDLGEDLVRFDITALRPPTFERLQEELTDAKAAGRPYRIVHFDGHGVYEDLSQSSLADWLKAIDALTLGGKRKGKHGYLMFEHPDGDEKTRPVPGDELGKLLHDTGVPVLVLNACQSAMHEGGAEPTKPTAAADVHDEVRAIGSLAQSVIDQGIPAVLGMRYSVFVVTAAQYIGQLYAALAKGRPFGEAASEGRKHLARNPDRWVGLQPRPLQDWFVPVVYEAMPLPLLPVKDEGEGLELGDRAERDPIQTNPALVRYVPDTGFIGRDETLLMLDRAFDDHAAVLLHAYAGQGKTATGVEFARWYAQTGGLGPQPVVLFTSFESHTDLTDVLNQIGQLFAPLLQANGIEWHALNDNAERRSLILQLLRQIPVLWIWDNVEPIAGFPAGTESACTPEEQAELATFLKQIKLDRATKAKILLTSRRDEQVWLGGIPHRVAMPRMTAADAAGLAVEIGAERQLDRRQIAHWQPLLAYCAGNPLTLRVLVSQAIKENRCTADQIEEFVAAIRSGEKGVQDEDETQGRDTSLGASLNYGFQNAFNEDELPVIALLHLFQGAVDVRALHIMGNVVSYGDEECERIVNPSKLKDRSEEELIGLLNRAVDTGLLTHLGSRWYTIHPALPWFLRQIFARNYPAGSSTASNTVHAWVVAIGLLSDLCVKTFLEGNREMIPFLELEESNFLHARRVARCHGWWSPLVLVMQGLREFYQYHGRWAEWARLVADIVPEYCTADDEPILGRTDKFNLIMEYRVELKRHWRRDFVVAAALQKKLVAWNRQRAADSLAVTDNASLDDKQRNHVRTLAVSVGTVGEIRREQGCGDCVEHYEEAIRLCERIDDNVGGARECYNLGLAYLLIPDIRDFDAAEAAFRRSLELDDPADALTRSLDIKQIGAVYHERLKEGVSRHDPAHSLEQHFRVAEEHYVEALDLCPASAIGERGPIHDALGLLYTLGGETEQAREHLELAVQCFEQTGDRYNAGQARGGIAIMYLQAVGGKSVPARQRDLLQRAQSYAEAALRDFQHYQGRAAADEARAQKLIDIIAQALAST